MGTMASQTTNLAKPFMQAQMIKQKSKLGVIGLCEGNSLVTGEFPAQRASYAETVSIRWRHHVNSYQTGIMKSCGVLGIQRQFK